MTTAGGFFPDIRRSRICGRGGDSWGGYRRHRWSTIIVVANTGRGVSIHGSRGTSSVYLELLAGHQRNRTEHVICALQLGLGNA